MDWIFKMIQPVIEGSETPEEAERRVKEWGETVHPRDAFCGLMAVWNIQAHWEAWQNHLIKLKQNK